MRLQVKIVVKSARDYSVRQYEQAQHELGGTHTPVIPLSTTVPGRVFPFLSANSELVGKNLRRFVQIRSGL